MATPGNGNDVKIDITANSKPIEDALQRILGMIEQVRQAAQNITVGGVGGGMSPGGGGAGGGAMPGGFASGASMVNRSAQPSPAPMGTVGRGTPSQPRAVTPSVGASGLFSAASVSPATPRPDWLRRLDFNMGMSGMAGADNLNQLYQHGYPGVDLSGMNLLPNMSGLQGVQGRIQNFMQTLAPYKPYAEGAMIVASMYGQQYYQGQIERMMTGRPDRMLEAGATGSLFGGMIGTAIGAPMGGAGAYVGAFAGTTIGGMIGQYFAGAKVRDTRIGVSLLPLAAHSAYRAGDMGHWGIGYGGEDHDGYSAVWRNPSLPAMVKRLAPRTKTVSGVIGRAFWQPPFDSDGNPAKEDAYMDYYATQEQVANMYGTAYQGFADAGFDPEMRIGATSALSVAGTSIANAFGNKAEDAISGRGKGFTLGRLVASVGGVAVGNSVARGGNSTQLYDWLGQNVAARYGTAGEGMMPGIMQMVGALRSVGGGIDSNGISTGPSGLIDLLMKFGTTRTAQFINAATPMGEKISTGESTLRDMVAKMQENEYLIKATSFDARGVGGRTEAMLKTMTSDIAAFPGGKGSLTYREVDARRRSAMFQRFAETDMEDFDIPMTRLQGQLDRSQLLPYAPGYSMGMEMQGFNARNVHLRTLEKRLETLKSRGDLSESQELAMVGQIEGLRTRNAQTIASLSEGMENRLPAMSAGRPFWAGRFNSMQLAAMYMRGPARFTGAYGGGQLAMQDDFARGIGLPSGTGSLTSGLNNGGAMSAITGYLAQIAANTGKTASEKTLPERRDPGGSRGRIN